MKKKDTPSKKPKKQDEVQKPPEEKNDPHPIFLMCAPDDGEEYETRRNHYGDDD